jgi:phospholipid/cholesterol/gamma-HCH transport system ATP-binding protein
MIRFEKVTKVLGRKTVLDELTFEVEKGETFVIVGSSGMGKSVTLKHMVRLLTPDSGQVLIGGKNISQSVGRSLAELRERFGYLFQGGALLAWLSVGENVGLPLYENTKLSKRDIDEKVARILGLVGLEADAAKMPSEISGGMRKRAGLARAIVRDPEIVLYDEPTSGLDPVTARTIDALIERMRRQLGVTSVVVTHDLQSALSIGTRIAMLHDGGFVEVSTPEEFIQSTQPEVCRFLESQFITKQGPWERNLK